MTTTDYREPTDSEIASIAHWFGGDTDRAAAFARRFPTAVGISPNPGTAAAALADQLDAAVNLARHLVSDYLVNVAAHLLVVDLAGERFRKPRLIADRGRTAYDRAFGAPVGRPEELPSGFTVPTETSFAAQPASGDTRIYAVLARVPDERMPVATRADLIAFVNEARKLKICDLQLNGDLCDGAKWTETVLVPFVRGDAIVFVSVCHFCWLKFCDKHGISAAEILDPDDVID